MALLQLMFCIVIVTAPIWLPIVAIILVIIFIRKAKKKRSAALVGKSQGYVLQQEELAKQGQASEWKRVQSFNSTQLSHWRLATYIMQCREKGVSDEAIRAHLLNTLRWSEAEVRAGFEIVANG